MAGKRRENINLFSDNFNWLELMHGSSLLLTLDAQSTFLIED
jgi:hypothetical protein